MVLRPGITVSDDALAAICRRYHVHELALFGSSARGDFHPDSDVDVLVEFEPDARTGFLALGALQRELAELLHAKVDLVSKRGLNPIIRDPILKQARLLYAA